MTNYMLNNIKSNLDPTPKKRYQSVSVPVDNYEHPQVLVDALSDAYHKIDPQFQSECQLDISYGEDYFEMCLSYERPETPQEVEQRIESAKKHLESYKKSMMETDKILAEIEEFEKSIANTA